MKILLRVYDEKQKIKLTFKPLVHAVSSFCPGCLIVCVCACMHACAHACMCIIQ